MPFKLKICLPAHWAELIIKGNYRLFCLKPAYLPVYSSGVSYRRMVVYSSEEENPHKNMSMAGVRGSPWGILGEGTLTCNSPCLGDLEIITFILKFPAFQYFFLKKANFHLRLDIYGETASSESYGPAFIYLLMSSTL